LNILQEARALNHLVIAGYNIREISNMVKKSSGWVHVRTQLLSLPEPIQNEAAAGFLNQADIKELASLPREQMYDVVKQIKDAKLQGGSLTVKKIKERKEAKIQKKLDRRVRSTGEMFAMQDLIRDLFGNGLCTRFIAWAAGQINDFEFMTTIKEEADFREIPWSIPIEIVEAHEKNLADLVDV
jgi:hypothetical protein